MDFIAPGFASEHQAPLLAPILMFGGLGLIAFVFGDTRRPRILCGVAAAVAATGFLALSVSIAFEAIAQETAIVDAIDDRYGTTLTPEMFEGLRYPVQAPEDGKLAAYGTTTIQMGGDPVTASLVWDGKVMLLVRPGEVGPGAELARR